MLRCFEALTKKEAVRKALEKKTEGTLILFHSQIADSRSRFDRNRLSPSLMDDEPTFAGAASWARGMKRRIEHDWALLQQARPWLPKVSARRRPKGHDLLSLCGVCSVLGVECLECLD